MDKLRLLTLLTSLVPIQASAQDSLSIDRIPDPVRIVQFRNVEKQPVCFAGTDTSNVDEGKYHIRYGDTFIIVVNRLPEEIKLADIQLVINDKTFPEYHPTSMVVNKKGVELFVTLDHVVDTNLARYLGKKRHHSNTVWIGLAKKDGSAITFLSLSFYNMEFIEFDSTQLALMGISSASYVGLKATQS